jgi:hypothetical protein
MKDIYDKAQDYWKRAGGTAIAHYRAAEVAQKLHNRIGLPNTVISAIVATSIFSTLSESTDIRIRIATGILALAALQTYYKYGERAKKHMSSGSQYTDLRRTLEIFFLKFPDEGASDRGLALQELEKITETLNRLDSDSPELTKAQFNQGIEEFTDSIPKLETGRYNSLQQNN